MLSQASWSSIGEQTNLSSLFGSQSPIMAVADYAVIGDLSTIVPAISAEIESRRAR